MHFKFKSSTICNLTEIPIISGIIYYVPNIRCSYQYPNTDADFAGVQFFENDLVVTLKLGENRQSTVSIPCKWKSCKGRQHSIYCSFVARCEYMNLLSLKGLCSGSYFHEEDSIQIKLVWLQAFSRWNLLQKRVM